MSLVKQSDWVHTKQPTGESGTTSRLWHWDMGGEYGWKDDGVIWYRLNCSYWFGDWIEEQDKSLWRSYGGRHRAIYIVREELMTLIRLKWL